MTDKKRITIRCWNGPTCGREYSWLATFSGEPTLFIACPFCGAEATVPLDPFLPPETHVYGGDARTATTPAAGERRYTFDRLALPDVVPSQPRPPSEPRPAAPEE